MARGQYQTKVQRPAQDAEGASAQVLACRTCPFWRERDNGRGICHGSSGPLTMLAGAGLFAATMADDWCRLHPQAPK